MIKKNLVCINCPLGCRLTVTIEDGSVQDVAGSLCKKGREYARQESVSPTRVVTSLMRLSNRDQPFSVKTSAPIPKERIFDCVKQIFATRPAAPIMCGSVVVRDVCGTGVDIIATQDVL